MKGTEELNRIVEKLIDFDNISVGFKVEFRDKESKKTYVLTENENGYILEIKNGNGAFRITLNSSEDIPNQNRLSDEDKTISSELFNRLNSNQVDKVSISGLRLRNPILTASIGQSIIANVSKQISSENRIELYNLWKENKEEFKEKFQDIVINKIISQLKDKLESADLPTPIFPTSVASSEIPNYYIYEPKETYTLDTKIELFNKLANSICGRCGQRFYGLYVPEEFFREVEGEIRNHMLDPFARIVNIKRAAGIGNVNINEIGPFEYLFYLLDRILQAMFRKDKIPLHHVELFVIEGASGGKKFFSHYVIPNLNEVFLKLYHGDDKYTSRGISKIKALISSFLIENWSIYTKLKKSEKQKYTQIVHAHINRLLYHIFCHRKLDMDSILFLEDLKIKLGDTTPIRYLEEVISWM